MQARRAISLMAEAVSKGYRIMVADRNGTGLRLLDLEEAAIVIAENARCVKALGSRSTLRQLVSADEPVFLESPGRCRKLTKPFIDEALWSGEVPCLAEGCFRTAGWQSEQSDLSKGTFDSASIVPNRRSINPEPGCHANLSRSIKRTIRYIEQTYTDPDLSLDRAANVACLSRSYFCRRFKKEVGVTYGDYLTQLRIERARALLRQGDLSIPQVCFDVGYNDLTHFERVFKRQVGTTPSRFRMN